MYIHILFGIRSSLPNPREGLPLNRRSGTVQLIADGFSFLEGPRWHEGALFVSDFYTHQVLRFGPRGHQVLCDVEGQPSGLGFTPDGHLLIVSMLDRRLLRLQGHQLTEVACFADLAPGPANDMVVDAAGRAYVGNFGYPQGGAMAPTSLVRIDPGGTTSIAATNVVFPNGAVLTPDGRSLLLAETFMARITAFDVSPEGALSNRRTWAQFAPAPDYLDEERACRELAVLPDGLALDEEGMLWVADAKGHGAARVCQDGDVVDFVDTGDLSVYAVALGGSDRRTLYLCCAPPLGTSDPTRSRRSVLLSCQVPVAGAGTP
ncbi:SMP-30/gluconolactonase/LRE family protein [Streptomyces sp. NPDC001177]